MGIPIEVRQGINEGLVEIGQLRQQNKQLRGEIEHLRLHPEKSGTPPIIQMPPQVPGSRHLRMIAEAIATASGHATVKGVGATVESDKKDD